MHMSVGALEGRSREGGPREGGSCKGGSREGGCTWGRVLMSMGAYERGCP